MARSGCPRPQKAHGLPKRRFAARRLHEENASNQFVNRFVVAQGGDGEKTAHFVQHGRLDSALGADFRLRQGPGPPEGDDPERPRTSCPQELAARPGADIRPPPRPDASSRGRRRPRAAQLADPGQRILPGPSAKPAPGPFQAASASRPVAEDLPQDDERQQSQACRSRRRKSPPREWTIAETRLQRNPAMETR